MEKDEAREREGPGGGPIQPPKERRQLKAPFRLVTHEEYGSPEVVACLRELLRDAEAGKLIGVAWVAMYKQREWDYRTCGEAHRNPAWTLGMLSAFSTKIADDINR